MKDVIVEEVRRVRHQIEKEFNHDTDMYLKHIYEAQKEHGRKLVRRQPKPQRKRRAI